MCGRQEVIEYPLEIRERWSQVHILIPAPQHELVAERMAMKGENGGVGGGGGTWRSRRRRNMEE